MIRMNKTSYELATPNPSALIQSLRAFGYDISTAIADLIDNSITANATQIHIQFTWESDNKPWIAIFDDGIGMSEKELFEAMKPGSKNPLDIRNEKDLGRFGLGLKTASFSQCRRLTVITKAKKGNVFLRCWDLDFVCEKNDWILLKSGSTIANKIAASYFKNRDSGTVILWEKLDRIVPTQFIDEEVYQSAFLDFAKGVEKHISLVFSGYMEGENKIDFYINGNPIELWDPFMSENGYTSSLPVEYLYVDGDANKEVIVQSYILPHRSKLTDEEYKYGEGINGWNEQQGFYVYRNNRLIVAGEWLLPKLQKKEQYKLARIRVDINNNLDTEWKIDVKKSIAVPPLSIKDDLERIAKAARQSSSRLFASRGKVIARKRKTEQAFVWHQIEWHGKIGYALNRNHPLIKDLLSIDRSGKIKALINIIEETIPVPAIISNFTDNKDSLNPFENINKSDKLDKVIEQVYQMFLEQGFSSREAIETMAGTEPFIYVPEKLQLFSEKLKGK